MCDKICPQRFVNLHRKQATSSEVQYTPVYFAKPRNKRHDIQYKEHLSNCYVGCWTNIDLSVFSSTLRNQTYKSNKEIIPMYPRVLVAGEFTAL